jgi:peroxin-11B
LFRTNNPKSSYEPFELAKKQLGVTRKIPRLGKFIEHFKAAATIADSRTLDPVHKFLATSRQLGYAGYLSFDALTVLDAAGIKKWEGAKRASQMAARFWLLGLSSSVLAGLYTLNRLRVRRVNVDKKEGEGVVESKKIEKYVHHPNFECSLLTVTREYNAAVLQLFTDCCDICLPSSALGYLDLDDGALGLLGTFSSLVGIYNVWEKCRQ